MKEALTSKMIATLAGPAHPMQNLLEDLGCKFGCIYSTQLTIDMFLAIDSAMDLDEEPSGIDPVFPPGPSEVELQPRFWTIGDDDFEPDPTPLQDTLLSPAMNQGIYDEYGEMAARAGAEDPTISPEEQEYLASLENLEYGEFTVCGLNFVLNPDLSL
jgi:hypothetical protein